MYYESKLLERCDRSGPGVLWSVHVVYSWPVLDVWLHVHKVLHGKIHCDGDRGRNHANERRCLLHRAH